MRKRVLYHLQDEERRGEIHKRHVVASLLAQPGRSVSATLLQQTRKSSCQVSRRAVLPRSLLRSLATATWRSRQMSRHFLHILFYYYTSTCATCYSSRGCLAVFTFISVFSSLLQSDTHSDHVRSEPLSCQIQGMSNVQSKREAMRVQHCPKDSGRICLGNRVIIMEHVSRCSRGNRCAPNSTAEEFWLFRLSHTNVLLALQSFAT